MESHSCFKPLCDSKVLLPVECPPKPLVYLYCVEVFCVIREIVIRPVFLLLIVNEFFP
jgi:hypothetical protein